MRKKTSQTCDKGYYVCKYCDGRGYLYSNLPGPFHHTVKKECDCCKGSGQVDWVEHITNEQYKKAVKKREAELTIAKVIDFTGVDNRTTLDKFTSLYSNTFDKMTQIFGVLK